MKKTLLFVGGGIEALDGIKHASALGFHTVVSDKNPDAPGLLAGDDRLIASTYNAEETARVAESFHTTLRPIDGCVAIAADVPQTLAAVNERLGLPGLSPHAALGFADKLLMKDRLAAAGVPVPWYAPVSDADHLKRLADDFGSEVVVKPVDSRGGRGVTRLSHCPDPDWAYWEAAHASPTGRVMVEAYLPGPQVSTESLVVEGRVHTVGFSDRNYDRLEVSAPYFIENGGDLPSALPEHEQTALRAVVERAALALGVVSGTIKGDLVWSSEGPHVIEMAGRMSGGFFCTREIPLSTGFDFIGNAFRLAVGDPIDETALTSLAARPIVQRYAFPAPGTVLSIDNAETIRTRPGIEDLVLYVKPGDVINDHKNSTSRAAMVLASGQSMTEARQRAETAIEDLSIRIAPSPESWAHKETA
ncbi:MAG: ATP-grasp domain-containing protein [Pseudomonadota bacterium]